MKSVVTGLLATVLFTASALCWSEAKLTRRVAQAHQRLATLRYGGENDISGEGMTLVNRLWPRAGSLGHDVERHRATVSYWLARYQSLAGMANATGTAAPDDPALLFVAANSAYRTSAPSSTDSKTAVDRLDGVIQAYADVLRKDPTHADAAFNYEYVARLRDTIAREKPSARAAREKKAVARPDIASVDLPAGPTIHGRPGGPPEGEATNQFKTISPMHSDERREQMDPGDGQVNRRKG